jgi:hypothetical protein
MTLSLQTSASADDVLEELKASIDNERVSFVGGGGYGGHRAFVGRVDTRGFRVQRRHRERNGFAPQLYGSVSQSAGKTVIRAETRMYRPTAIALTIVMIFFILIGLPLILGAPRADAGQLPAAVWLGGSIVLVVGLVIWGRLRSRDDPGELRTFLEEVVKRAEARTLGQR